MLADDIEPLEFKTLEELANGREIKEYPKKYDDFNSEDSLKEFIKDYLATRPYLKSEWIRVDKGISYKMDNWDKDVYYTEVGVNGISAWDCETYKIYLELELNPNKWSIEVLERIVGEIKIETKDWEYIPFGEYCNMGMILNNKWANSNYKPKFSDENKDN